MSCHLIPEPMRLIAGSFHDFRRHSEHAGLTFFGGIHYTSGDHEFDMIRTRGRNLTHVFPGLFRRLCLRGDGSGKMSSRYRHPGIPGKDPRSDQFSVIDLIPDPCIHIQNPAHGADGSDAAHQFRAGISFKHSFQHEFHKSASGKDLKQPFIVRWFFVRLGRFSTGCHVNMEIDQSGKNVCSLQIDDLTIGNPVLIRLDLFDFPVLDSDHHSRNRLHLSCPVQYDSIF